MTWAELAARVWLLLRVVMHDVRKAYRRQCRRIRYRHGVTLYSMHGATGLEAIDGPRPGAVIPMRPGFTQLNDLLKQCYTHPLAPSAELLAQISRDRQHDDLDDTAFIFPCHERLQ